MAPHYLPQHYRAGETDIKNSCVIPPMGLCFEIVKQTSGGKELGIWCSNCGTRPLFARLGNLGGHKIRNRYAVHYILTSLRSWLQSLRRYWVFLPPSASSPDKFSENIKDWVINSNMNRETQLARHIQCEKHAVDHNLWWQIEHKVPCAQLKWGMGGN